MGKASMQAAFDIKRVTRSQWWWCSTL